MSATPAWKAYLNSVKLPATVERAGSADPTIRGYENASARAAALGINVTGKAEPGLLTRALYPLDLLRATAYAGSTELVDGLTGRGFSTDDFTGKFGRAMNEGEGFGSTELLSADDDDSFWMRALKMGGSVAADVLSDPLTYASLGLGTAAKATVGGLARAGARKTLSDVGQEAAEQAARKLGPEFSQQASEGIYGDLARRHLRTTTKLADDEIERVLAGQTDEVMDLAARRLGDVIGSARIAGSGRMVRRQVAREFSTLGIENSDELALRVTQNLGQELSGGIRMSVPLTKIGFNLTKGAGTGTDALRLGGAADKLNEVRLGARAALRGPNSLLGKVSGESGTQYNTVVRNLASEGVEEVLENPGLDSASTLTDFLIGNTAKRSGRRDFILVASNAARGAKAAKRQFGDEARADSIIKASMLDFGMDDALRGLDPDDEGVVALVRAGREMRDVFAESARLRGVAVDPDKSYVPRLVEVTEYNRRKATSPGSNRKVGDTNSSKKRKVWADLEEVVGDDDELLELLRRDLSPAELNARAGRTVVEEDPFIILQRGVEREATRVEQKLLADSLSAARVIADDINPLRAERGELLADVQKVVTKLEGKNRPAQAVTSKNVKGLVGKKVRVAESGRVGKLLSVDGDVAQVQFKTPKGTLKKTVSLDKLATLDGPRVASRAASVMAAETGLAAARSGDEAAAAAGAVARQAAAVEADRVAQQVKQVEGELVAARKEVRSAESALARVATADDRVAKQRLQSRVSRAKKRAAEVDSELRNAKRRLKAAEKKAASFRDEVRDGYVELNNAARKARASAQRAADKAAAVPENAAAQKRAATAARKADEAEQAVQDFLAKTDAPNQSRALSGKVAAERGAVDDLSARRAGVAQTIETTVADIASLDQAIAGSVRADDLRNLATNMTDDEAAAVRRAAEAATNLEAKQAAVAQLKAERVELDKAARQTLPAEYTARTTVKQAEALLERAVTQDAAATGARAEIRDRLYTINRALDESNNWEQVAEAFTDLKEWYRQAGDTKSVRDIDKASRLTNRLGVAQGQQDAFDTMAAAKGWVSLGSEDGATKFPSAFENKISSQGVSDSLDRMFALSGSETGIRAAMAPYLDPYMHLFKLYATIGRGPGYHVRNFIGGMVNNMLIGVQGNTVAPAFKISRTIHHVTKQIEKELDAGTLTASKAGARFDEVLARELSWKVGKRWGAGTAYDMARGFLAEGVQYSRTNELMERGAADAVARAGGKGTKATAKTKVNPKTAAAVRNGDRSAANTLERFADSRAVNENVWIRWNATWAEETETFMRMSAYLEGAAQYGGDQVAAAGLAKAAHFDYQDLSDTEVALKMVVPFYTWMRYNIPAQMRFALNKPGSLNRLEAVARNLKMAFGDEDAKEDGLLPEWIARRKGFETPWTMPGGGKLALMVESPQLDLFQMFGGNGKNPLRGDELIESLAPTLKVPFELLTGRDMTTGQETTKMETLRGAAPPVNSIMRLAGLTDRDSERQGSSLLSFIGVPAGTITEGSRRSEALRRTARISSKVQAELGKYLGEGEEIDAAWLAEASTLYKPDYVKTLLERGYGRKGGPKSPEEDAENAEREARRQQRKPAAVELLKSLSRGY
jgi:hypothetical protein